MRIKYHLHIFTMFLFIPAILAGCALEDDRDECCQELIINFRYTLGGEDFFPRRISKIHHWIFDKNDILISEFEADKSNMQRIALELPAGDYSILSIGNINNTEKLDSQTGVSNLKTIMLMLSTLDLPDDKDNCSRLYYGYRTFKSIENERLVYYSDMSNIHCVMDVTVRWKGNAPVTENPYTVRLSNIAGRYSSMLPVTKVVVNEKASKMMPYNNDIECTLNRVVHSFPFSCREVKVCHKQEVNMYNNQLRTQFVSLRYRDDQIPFISITNGAEELLSPKDLTETFRRNGWTLDNNIEQKFSIVIEIDPGGKTVTIMPAEVDSNDWTDGGTIG